MSQDHKKQYDAGNPEDVTNRKKVADEREVLRTAGLRGILESREGRIFLYELLGQCGIYQISYTGNSETFFREGKRAVGLQLLSDIVKCNNDAYISMLKENSK
jgi:hypothetical protein